MELMNKLWAAAKADKRRIVLPEGDEERTIKATGKIVELGLARPVLVGDEDVIRSKAKELDVPLCFHEEDPSLITVAGINEGEISKKLGISGASNVAEDVMVARDCMIAIKSGAKVNIQHISSGVSVETVRMAKKLGANVYAEATPHHFTITEEEV